MDIFKNLENLEVSEECFDDIMGIVEEILSERDFTTRPRAAARSIEGRSRAVYDARGKYADVVKKDMKKLGVPMLDFNGTKVVDGKVNHVYGYDEDDHKHRIYVPASSEVQDAHKELSRAGNRLGDAEVIARQSVSNAIKHEEDHKKKVHGN